MLPRIGEGRDGVGCGWTESRRSGSGEGKRGENVDTATTGIQGDRLAGSRQGDEAARGRGDDMAVGMGDGDDGGELGNR